MTEDDERSSWQVPARSTGPSYRAPAQSGRRPEAGTPPARRSEPGAPVRRPGPGSPGRRPEAGAPQRRAEPGAPARRPDHVAARLRLERQIATSRTARRQRLTLTIIGAMSVLTLLISGSAWVLTSYISSRIARINAGTSGTPTSGPVNILVAGIDTRGGLTRHQELRLHVGSAISTNSDTLMLVHIPADHQSAYVVSLPRDSWVNIPGHGMNKINAAFGEGGPQLMVRTVERATGMTINDYVEVNFLGFVKVINAVGGVNICVPFAVNDPYSGLHLTAGPHHVDGITALSFARDRHSFAASDLARIQDQQQLLSSLIAQATQTGVLADPVRLEQFLSSVTGVVKVDSGFDLVRLAEELRGMRASNVTFTTVPIANASYMTSTGQDAVLWDSTAATALFNWLKKDTGTRRPARSRSPGSRQLQASRAAVSVDVYNGTTIQGLASATGTKLAAAGFKVHQDGLNWPSQSVPQTMIQYPASQAAQARLLANVLAGATLQQVAGLTRIRLVLGASGHTVAGGAAGSPTQSAAQAPGTAGQARTAAQDACH